MEIEETGSGREKKKVQKCENESIKIQERK